MEKNLSTMADVVAKMAGRPQGGTTEAKGILGEFGGLLKELGLGGNENSDVDPELLSMMKDGVSLTRELMRQTWSWQIRDFKKRLGIVEHITVEG